MKKIALLFILVLSSTIILAQEFKTYNFNEFEPFLHKQDNKIYVINFWATWCRPCVEEIPAFNQLYQNYHHKDVEIIMVSLDFGKNLQDRIQAFKERHSMQARIVILDDPDSNSWIDKVSTEWSGAIPATIIYNKSERQFYEQSFTYKELESELKKFL